MSRKTLTREPKRRLRVLDRNNNGAVSKIEIETSNGIGWYLVEFLGQGTLKLHSGDHSYQVWFGRRFSRCSCPAYVHFPSREKGCKHAAAIQALGIKEGWL